jgi:hypothetical protein
MINLNFPLRLPSSPPNPNTHPLPPTPIQGQWYLTHTSTPFWRDKRNITISYTPRPTTITTNSAPQLENLTTYQTLTSATLKTVHGIDTPFSADPASSTYDWQGVGWLRIARSRWEVLGWGYAPLASDGEGGVAHGLLDEGVEGEQDGAGECGGEHRAVLLDGGQGAAATAGVQWMVTFAQKSLFTPAGVNVCCRVKEGLPEGWQRELEKGLAGSEDEGVRTLVGGLFAVRQE